MSGCCFTLGEWQGPLDLLLHLIAKHRMDIYDIPITELLEQYLAYLDKTPERDLDEAAEFLEMAARLIYIKTAMLLPRPEEVESLKQELTGELLEYQLCQEIARELGARSTYQEVFARAPEQVEDDAPYAVAHDPLLLRTAYLLLAGKSGRKLPPPAQSFSGIVHRRFVPVAARITAILTLLYRRERVGYRELFLESRDRSELVATFLAVLELVRIHRVAVEGETPQDLALAFVPLGAGGQAAEENWEEELQAGAAFWDDPLPQTEGEKPDDL